MTTMNLFDPPVKTRKKRQWLMHVSDASQDCCCEGPGEQIVKMTCARCGTETDWISMPNVTTAKRGIPCEKCNEATP